MRTLIFFGCLVALGFLLLRDSSRIDFDYMKSINKVGEIKLIKSLGGTDFAYKNKVE